MLSSLRPSCAALVLALAAACGSSDGTQTDTAINDSDLDADGDVSGGDTAPDAGADAPADTAATTDTGEDDADASNLPDADAPTPDADVSEDTPSSDAQLDADVSADAANDPAEDADTPDADAGDPPDADAGSDATDVAITACSETVPCAPSISPCVENTCVDGACVDVPTAEGMPCDDASACTSADVCSSGSCVGAPIACDDGDACNGAETCDAATGCVDGSPLSCDDFDVCNGVETCDPAVGCVSDAPLVCSDGDACNGLELCDRVGGCIGVEELACDDFDVCNGVETCEPTTGCVAGVPLACSDGDACNGAEACDADTGCLDGVPLVCDPLICDATIGCPVTCAGDLDCIEGYVCASPTARCGVPSVRIIAPASNPALLGIADDVDPVTPGLQINLGVVLAVAPSGTMTVTSSILDGPPLAVVPITAGTNTLDDLWIPDGEQVIDVSVAVDGPRDLTVSAQATFIVDTVPPAAPTITVSGVNRRSGACTVTFDVVGDDDSAGAASTYELVRSPDPLDATSIDAATVVATVVADGAETTFDVVIDELPWDAAVPSLSHTHQLALRAFDDVGNPSEVSNNAAVDLAMYELVIDTGLLSFDDTRYAAAIGDVDGDLLSDVAFGMTFGGVSVVRGDTVLPPASGSLSLFTRTVGAASGWWGYRICDAIDLNGDGFSDLVVGDHAHNAGGGGAFVYFGSPEGLPATPSVVLRGSGGSDAFPGIMRNVGDVIQLGDEHIDDILLTSTTSWSAYIIAGRETWPSTVAWSGDPATNVANGVVRIDRGGTFGELATRLSDSDDDGFGEFAILGPFRSGESTQIHVFDGGPIADVASTGFDEAILDSPFPTTTTATQMLGADVLGDGRGELILHTSGRRVAIISFDAGLSGEVALNTTVSAAGGGFATTSMDINDDGDTDVVYATGGVVSAFVQRDGGGFRMQSGAIAPDLAYTPISSTMGRVGVAVSDFNGDGYEDLMLGDTDSTSITLIY